MNTTLVPTPNANSHIAGEYFLFFKLYKQAIKNKRGIKSKYPFIATE